MADAPTSRGSLGCSSIFEPAIRALVSIGATESGGSSVVNGERDLHEEIISRNGEGSARRLGAGGMCRVSKSVNTNLESRQEKRTTLPFEYLTSNPVSSTPSLDGPGAFHLHQAATIMNTPKNPNTAARTSNVG